MKDYCVEPVNFKASKELISTVKNILEDLEYYGQNVSSTDVYLKVLKESPTREKEVGIKVLLKDRNCVFLSKTGGSFITTTQEVSDSLKSKLIAINQRSV